MSKWFNIFARGFPHALGLGSQFVLIQHIIGYSLIASSFLLISIAILTFASRRRFEFSRTLVLLALAFGFCGLARVMEIIVLYNPLYILEGWVMIITGIISWVALLNLVPVLTLFLRFLDSPDIARQNIMLIAELSELERTNRRRKELDILKAMRLRALSRELHRYALSMDVEITDYDNNDFLDTYNQKVIT